MVGRGWERYGRYESGGNGRGGVRRVREWWERGGRDSEGRRLVERGRGGVRKVGELWEGEGRGEVQKVGEW